MYTFTNHFSKSELNARIQMIHQPGSSAVVWLRYPVLFLAVVTIASAFVQPQQVRRLSTFVPKPITEALANISVPMVETHMVPDSVEAAALVTDSVSIEEKRKAVLEAIMFSEPDSFRRFKTPPISPSKYIAYQGNRLWWIITAKTTLEDIFLIKGELAKYGLLLQPTALIFDWRHSYVDYIDYRLRTKKLSNDSGQPDLQFPAVNSVDRHPGKPILATGGYLEWSNPADSSKFSTTTYMEIRPTAKTLPDKIRQVIIDDESFVANAIATFKSDSVAQETIYAGQTLRSRMGDSIAFFKKETIQAGNYQLTGLTINPDNSLTINDDLKNIPVFINNESVSPEAVSMWSSKQVHAVVRKFRRSPNKQDARSSAIFIYAVEK